MTKLSRAQTPEEKIAKGEFILHVAERIIRDEGLDALSRIRCVIYEPTGTRNKFRQRDPLSVFHHAP